MRRARSRAYASDADGQVAASASPRRPCATYATTNASSATLSGIRLPSLIGEEIRGQGPPETLTPAVQSWKWPSRACVG
jgi:hypothetical protein